MKKIIATILFLYSTQAVAVEIAPEPSSGFKEQQSVESNKYMVVSGHKLASQAGEEIIKQGGNAVDATIATQMVLNLVEPHASGIGGGGFLLYFDKQKNEIKAYDGRETAPFAVSGDMFLDKNGNAPEYKEALKGGLSVGTPGLLKMLWQVHQEQGKLPWDVLFAPAIQLAERGFPISPRLHAVIESTPYIAGSPEAKALFFEQDGSIKKIGEVVRNKQLAKTLHKIAKEGPNALYKGEIAKAIVNIVKNNTFKPGRLEEGDLASYQAIERKPVCINYHDYKICSMPPPTSGGITLLQALKTVEGFNLNKKLANSIDSIHLVMEALRLAFADRNEYVADCAFALVPKDTMLSDKYLKTRAALIKENKVIENPKAGEFKWDGSCGKQNYANEHNSTTHMSIIDNLGNAVSLTSSIEYSFGSGLMVKGFFLNNELTDFSLVPTIDGKKVANAIEPGKRPRSSMTPVLIFNKDGSLHMVIGSPGGSRIISYVLQTIISALDWGMNLHEAINQPHYATTGMAVELEQGTEAEKLYQPLVEIGHKVIIGDLTSGLHGIEIKGNKLIGGVDKRREGEARGE